MDSTVKVSQAAIFAMVLGMIIIWTNLRRFVLLISLFFIIVMAVLYIVDIIEWAEIFGSTSIGLVVLVLLSYLPQLINKGYIENL